MNPSLPSSSLLALQSSWLEPARSRILRIAEIARRRCVLDLGAGFGHVTPELIRRSGGAVIALDLSLNAMRSFTYNCSRVCADAVRLPFRTGKMDLVFCQNVMLWVADREAAVREIFRILEPGGKAVLIEPDYGGMMEYPPEIETAPVWINALSRAGADPHIGRKLSGTLLRTGFRIRVELLPRLVSPQYDRFECLKELPLSPEESSVVERATAAAATMDPALQVTHLPYFLIVADRP